MISNNFQFNKINFKNKIKTKYLKNIIKEYEFQLKKFII